MSKTKTRKLFLNSPPGVKVQRFNIGGDNKEIRFTIPAVGFYKLVAVARNNRFTWIHKDFQS